MTNWTNTFYSFLQQHPSLQIAPAKRRWDKSNRTPAELAEDEIFWNDVRADFSLTDYLVNLNNGAVSSAPDMVEKAYLHYYKLVNTAPSYFIWKVMEHGKEVIREGLSQLINCSKEEVAILRNTTEAANNAIFGIELQAGDEVVLCKQDYAKVVSAWKQRELRDQIKLLWVDIDPSDDSNEDIVSKYTSLFSNNTKLVQLTHVINWNGQILPVEPIIKEAKQRGIEVMLDGAHSFGLLETDMEKLGCDYFVTALHKWLSGPIPSALLYVKKNKIRKTWPLASSIKPQSEDIRKFEELSIQLYPNVLALGYAIEYYQNIGRKIKEERLRYLRRQWTSSLQQSENIQFNTPLDEERCCTIVNVSCKGWKPEELESELFRQYKIHVGIVNVEPMKGIRITPNIYTRPESLHLLVRALKEMPKAVSVA